MSKNRTVQSQPSLTTPALQAAEHVIIKHDLLKVVVLNVIYLAGLLVLFSLNQKSHFLEAWFSKVLGSM